jgi:hypothetical protein
MMAFKPWQEYRALPLIVRIKQYQFELLREYTAGHVLTEGEAAALNQMLTENIRNNAYPWVVKAAQGGFLTAEQQQELSERINEYANNYQFKTRVRTKSATPLESTARELAIQEAEIWGQQNGYSPDSHEVNSKFHELLTDPQVRERARDLIRHRQSVVEDALEGLI